MFCHTVHDVWDCYIEEFFFFSDIYFVVPFGTYLNYDEDVDILVELNFMFLYLLLFFVFMEIVLFNV